jgi:hypothetical protein
MFSSRNQDHRDIEYRMRPSLPRRKEKLPGPPACSFLDRMSQLKAFKPHG